MTDTTKVTMGPQQFALIREGACAGFWRHKGQVVWGEHNVLLFPLDLGSLVIEREADARIVPGRDAFHELLDLLQVAAHAFLFRDSALPRRSASRFAAMAAGEVVSRGSARQRLVQVRLGAVELRHRVAERTRMRSQNGRPPNDLTPAHGGGDRCGAPQRNKPGRSMG